MTDDRKLSSIEANFKMENMLFDAECRLRVKKVLTNRMTVTDAIIELNKKYEKIKNFSLQIRIFVVI